MFKNYKVLKGIINKQVCDIAVRYCELTKTKAKYLLDNNLIPFDSTTYGIFGDGQIPKKDVFAYYGSDFFDSLLVFLKKDMERETNKKLKCMYSYFRIYTKGSVLSSHKDRKACEFSTTLNLGGDPWPIYFLIDDKEVEITLKPGDMIIYKGADLKHWRNKFKGKKCYQVFLHYTDVKSKTSLNDGRAVLGISTKMRNHG
tara:strand:+ start:2136 stop:2735 length:600 start_codon:yes stop_codon:yes gene_type:complete